MAASPTQTSLATLRDAAPARIESMPAVRAGYESLQSFELMQRGAKALSASTLVPATFQNNLPNCMIALELAQRLGASPLLVMQNLYVVHGRPGWSAQFLIATFNQCGRFSSIQYKFEGTEGKDDWGCRATATEKASGETITGPLVTIGLAKKEGWYSKSGSKWQTIPQLMLMYRAASWLVRTYAPELSMGISTQDEIRDTITIDERGNVITQDDIRAAEPLPTMPNAPIEAIPVAETGAGVTGG